MSEEQVTDMHDGMIINRCEWGKITISMNIYIYMII